MLNQYDKIYTSFLRIFNPYETFPYKLNKKIPMYDLQAYKLNPKHRFVYDKLFIIQSQNLACGELKDFKSTFPIFIKPRWGHKTASSKNCYKIKSQEELTPHLNKQHMMWSVFIDAKEGMTDFVLVNGEIVYQLTYVYSEKQYGFADVWKYVSSDNTPPIEVTEWVNKHLNGYTGPLNVQYRDTIIIEVGLRFARSGMYIESSEHKPLIDAINTMWETKTWMIREDLDIQPFYTFKCWSPLPVVCLIPQHVLDAIMKTYGAMPFYEYYFEPTGKRSTVFFQFLHKDFNTGMKVKHIIESLLLFINVSFILACVVAVGCFILKIPCQPLWATIFGMMVLSADNSLHVLYSQITHQKQFLL